MAGLHGTINQVANDDHNARTNMMDLWKESIQRTRKEQQAPVQTAKSEEEAKNDLEQRIRNGQAECPTCAARAYRDESDDGGVSFQAAKHISGATAGVVVVNHEHEHVSAEEESYGENGTVRQSTVGLEYGKCPECGRTYVKGGVTRTITRPASYRKQTGGLDTQV